MKELDFEPAKSKTDFRKNYKLHDIAEWHGKNLLTQWGVKFGDFGGDNRFKKVWEKGKDKPDLVIEANKKIAFMDWKGKNKPLWIVNKRAYESYRFWSEKHGAPVFIVFFHLDSNRKVIEKRIASLTSTEIEENSAKQWDKNETVKFKGELMQFSRVNLITLWRQYYE